VVSVFETSVEDRAFESRSGQIENLIIGICCFSAKHAALMTTNKDSNPRSTTLEVSTLPTCISVIFLNADRFDKSNRKYLSNYINIVRMLIRIWISKHELYK
jgi:hypothetical protein